MEWQQLLLHLQGASAHLLRDRAQARPVQLGTGGFSNHLGGLSGGGVGGGSSGGPAAAPAQVPTGAASAVAVDWTQVQFTLRLTAVTTPDRGPVGAAAQLHAPVQAGGKRIWTGCVQARMGSGTRQAYRVLEVGMDAAARLGVRRVTVQTDLEAVAQQLQGEQRPKKGKLRKLHSRVGLAVAGMAVVYGAAGNSSEFTEVAALARDAMAKGEDRDSEDRAEIARLRLAGWKPPVAPPPLGAARQAAGQKRGRE